MADEVSQVSAKADEEAQVQEQQAAQQEQQRQQAAQQQGLQAISAAAQLGEQIQRSGIDVGLLFRLVAVVQKNGAAIAALGSLFNDLKDVFGGAGQAPEAGAAPGGRRSYEMK